MYKTPIFPKSSITQNDSYEGETIENKVERIITNKEPITDGAPIVHQDRQEGVMPAYDIRTDRFDLAVDAMTKVDQSKKATRAERIKEYNEKMNPKKDKKDTEGESTQTTSTGSEGAKE